MNDYRELHELYHHGIKGQRWGVRRFQNEDGSLTPAGQKRYHVEYDMQGRSQIYDQKGNKIDINDVRHFEKAMEMESKSSQEARDNYMRYRNARNVKNSYTIGIGGAMPLVALAMNAATAKQRQAGKNVVDEMLVQYANTYLDDIAKK